MCSVADNDFAKEKSGKKGRIVKCNIEPFRYNSKIYAVKKHSFLHLGKALLDNLGPTGSIENYTAQSCLQRILHYFITPL